MNHDAPDLPYQESPNITYQASDAGDVYCYHHGRREWYCRVRNWHATTAAARWRDAQRSDRRERERRALEAVAADRQVRKARKMKAW